MELIGAIDQGTSSSRFILFDKKGKVVAAKQIETKQIFPEPGWVEHDPANILDTVNKCIDDAVSTVPGAHVVSVGITNQRETTVVWDKFTGEPLYNAIVWCDTRTHALVTELSSLGGADRFRHICGLPISTYFSAVKYLWMLRHVPGLNQAVKEGRVCFGTIDTWLIWKLTGGPQGGVHVTDVTNASRTMLMNLETKQWDSDLCKQLGICPSVLPAIRSSAERYGDIAAGPLKGVAISGCLGDQQAALVGQLCLEPGQGKNTFGTGCFLLVNTGTTAVQSHHGLLTTAAFQLGPSAPCYFALEGAVAVSGAAVTWMRDNLKLIKRPEEINELASSVNDNGGVYFVPAFSGLLSPYWREDARGVITGLTHYSNSGHLARAVLEASAYQTRDVLHAMAQDAGAAITELKVDGGLTGSDLMLNFLADILDTPVVRPAAREATVRGAAIVAGLASGFWSGLEEVKNVFGRDPSDMIFRPKMGEAERNARLSGWHKAVERSCGWIDVPGAKEKKENTPSAVEKSPDNLSTINNKTWSLGLLVGLGALFLGSMLVKKSKQ